MEKYISFGKCIKCKERAVYKITTPNEIILLCKDCKLHRSTSNSLIEQKPTWLYKLFFKLEEKIFGK